MARPLPEGPPDAIATATPQPLRSVVPALAAAALAALLLGSQGLLDWASELPVGPASDQAVMIADTWHGLVERTGLDAPAAWLRDLRTRIAGP